jgi:hypothetical protein
MAKRLITEACVRRLAAGAELVIDPQTIVTPAALDLAFARGHRVRRVSGDEAGAAAGPDAGEGARLAERLAADGVYQVVVRDGRARVWRVTDGGIEEVE